MTQNTSTGTKFEGSWREFAAWCAKLPSLLNRVRNMIETVTRCEPEFNVCRLQFDEDHHKAGCSWYNRVHVMLKAKWKYDSARLLPLNYESIGPAEQGCHGFDYYYDPQIAAIDRSNALEGWSDFEKYGDRLDSEAVNKAVRKLKAGDRVRVNDKPFFAHDMSENQINLWSGECVVIVAGPDTSGNYHVRSITSGNYHVRSIDNIKHIWINSSCLSIIKDTEESKKKSICDDCGANKPCALWLVTYVDGENQNTKPKVCSQKKPINAELTQVNEKLWDDCDRKKPINAVEEFMAHSKQANHAAASFASNVMHETRGDSIGIINAREKALEAGPFSIGYRSAPTTITGLWLRDMRSKNASKRYAESYVQSGSYDYCCHICGLTTCMHPPKAF